MDTHADEGVRAPGGFPNQQRYWYRNSESVSNGWFRQAFEALSRLRYPQFPSPSAPQPLSTLLITRGTPALAGLPYPTV